MSSNKSGRGWKLAGVIWFARASTSVAAAWCGSSTCPRSSSAAALPCSTSATAPAPDTAAISIHEGRDAVMIDSPGKSGAGQVAKALHSIPGDSPFGIDAVDVGASGVSRWAWENGAHGYGAVTNFSWSA